MDREQQNKGSFDVISKIGKAKPNKDNIAEPLETSPNEKLDIAAMQQRYLWECTFEVL